MSQQPGVGQDTSGLHVVGGSLRNTAGEVVQLHGVNRSSWEYTCFDGSGDTHDGGADQAEVAAMKAWNINAVRVVLNEDCWLGINGVTVGGAAYQTAVENYVALLSSNNIVPIVNLHFNAPGTHLATEQEPMADSDHSPAFWRSVAAAFAGDSRVIFEPYNEPHDISWSCWLAGGCSVQGSQAGEGSFTVAGMQQLVDAIRNTGADNVIIATGNNWGSDVSQWLQYKPSDPLNQLAVGWHSYGDGLSCQTLSCWSSTLSPLIAAYPLVATEIGEFDCKHSYIDQVMSYLDSQQQGYLAWAWGPYNCAKDPALLSDWSGTPTQTYGQGYHDHLLGLSGGTSGTPSPTVTPTPTPTKPPAKTPTATPTPTQTSTSGSGFLLYGGRLARGWFDSSWDANVNYTNTSPTYQGRSDSIALTVNAAYGAIEMRTSTPLQANSYTSVIVAVEASTSGQAYGIWLSDVDDNQIGQELPLASYGGQLVAGSWRLYSIPLSAFGLTSQSIYGVAIEDALGHQQPVVYIGEVAFR